MTATTTTSSASRFAAAGRRRRWRRWCSRPAIAAVVVAALLGGAAYVALGTDALAVKTVAVTGTRDVAASAVQTAAGVQRGGPMVRLDGEAVSARVRAALVGVESVSVQREWPSTVRLVVRERTAAAAVPQGRGYVLVDRGGVVYRSIAAAPAGVPILRVGSPGPQDPATTAGLAVLLVVPAEVRPLLARVDAPTAEQVVLVLRDGRQIVWGGTSDAATKSAVVRVLLKRRGRVIDVSSPGLATVR